MNERHEMSEYVVRWIDKAEHDLLAAEHMMKLAECGLTDIVCFHCQQCAEKYLNTLLLVLKIHFPKTHDLRLLLDLIQLKVLPDLPRTQVIPLNRYVIEGRYPGDWEPITTEEAREAIAMAQQVRTAVRAVLPNEMLDT